MPGGFINGGFNIGRSTFPVPFGSFSGVLDEVEGAVFAIAPYTQLSKTQTQSIEVRETGGDTEEIFGPESQADIEAFVVPADIKALFNERMYFDGVDDKITAGGPAIPATDDFDLTFKYIPKNLSASLDDIISQYDGSAEGRFLISTRNNNIRLFIGSTSGNVDIESNDAPLVNNGHYTVRVTRVSNVFTLYLDGEVIGTDTNSVSILQSKPLAVAWSFLDRYTRGVIYDIVIDGVLQWNGYGNTNADWEDQIGTNDGTVSGSPALFTGQGFDGRIATAYNQGSEAADALQATAANQPFIATAGVLEDGMRFDGSSTTLSVANFTPTANATLAAWVKPAAATNVGYVMAVGNPATTGQNRLNLNWLGSSDIIRYVSEAENIDSDAVFGGTDWTFVTITVSGKNISFFRNAVAAGTGTVTDDPVLTDETLRVGSRDGDVYFNGLIDAPAIWPRVLTPDEITKVYNATDPR